jgi:ferric-dicitrate binding protein FerR (iron transport regulator)
MKMRSLLAGAAAGVCLAFELQVPGARVSAHDYSMAWDDTKDLDIAYGVRARCTGNSHVRSTVTPFLVRIAMQGHCVLFVRPDPSRVVLIATRQNLVEDNGTVFDVVATGDTTVVTTLSDSVQLTSHGRHPVDMGAVRSDEQASITQRRGVLHVDIHRTPAEDRLRLALFSEGKMEIVDTVDKAVEIFNSNNHELKICIPDSGFGSKSITAIIGIHDRDGLVRLIRKINLRG